MVKNIIIFSLLIITNTVFGQLGQTRSHIISVHGSSYKSKITKDGEPYIAYDSTIYSQKSGSYNRTTAYYFDQNNMCKMLVYFEPISEINSWVSFFNNNYVNVTELSWKDYSKSINIYVKNLEGLVVAVTFKYDD